MNKDFKSIMEENLEKVLDELISEAKSDKPNRVAHVMRFYGIALGIRIAILDFLDKGKYEYKETFRNEKFILQLMRDEFSYLKLNQVKAYKFPAIERVEL